MEDLMARNKHDENQGERKLNALRKRNMALSILMCIVCMAALLLPAQGREQSAYAFESAADFDLEAARSAYAETGENAELYRLSLALCRAAYLEGADYDPAALCACGRELYRRAKAGNLDLEEIGDPEDTAAMLALLKDYGVTPNSSESTRRNGNCISNANRL